MSKKPQDSIKKKRSPIKSCRSPIKNYGYFGEYHDLFTFKTRPVPESWIEELAREVMVWSDESTSYRMSDFYKLKGITQRDYWEFKSKSKVLQDAHDYAMANLASRREIGGLTNKLNAGLVSQTMPIYDSDWKGIIEWKANLANKDGKTQGDVNVYMDSIKVASTKKDE